MTTITVKHIIYIYHNKSNVLQTYTSTPTHQLPNASTIQKTPPHPPNQIKCCFLKSFSLSSRWYLCAQESPCVFHSISQKIPQCCLWNGSNVHLTDNGPLLSFQGRLSSISSFRASLLQVIDWCDVLDFVPAGSVSSFSTLQLFQEASYLWGLLCPLVYLLGYFPSVQRVQSQVPIASIYRIAEATHVHVESTASTALSKQGWQWKLPIFCMQRAPLTNAASAVQGRKMDDAS